MTTEADVQDRARRAREQEFEHWEVKTDPAVVEVDNADHGSTHSVIPEQRYCSCEDHVYRGAFCKHLFYLVLETEYREDILNDLRERESEIEEEIDELREEQDRIVNVLTAIGIDEVDQNSDDNPWGTIFSDQDRTPTDAEDDAVRALAQTLTGDREIGRGRGAVRGEGGE